MKMSCSCRFIVSCLMVLAPCAVAAAQEVLVSDVEALYSAVNDPANAGATLVLAPGRYLLSTTDPAGAPRPKGGRLEMQPDMSIRGVEGDRSAVVLDAFDLPASSFPQMVNGVATGTNAVVRMGLGHNALEWLTVRDGRNASANIDAGLQPLDPGTAFVRVAHVDSSGSTRGLNVINFGPTTAGQTIEVEIIDCDLHDNPSLVAEGVRLGNIQGANGSIVNARMSGNRVWGNKLGRFIVNNRTVGSTVNVTSSGDQFYGNGAGTVIIGGFSSNNVRSDGNTITFEAHGNRFVENTLPSEFDHGGLVVVGGEDTSLAGGGSGNTVLVTLWGARMLGNDTADLVGIGARSRFAATEPFSRNNQVRFDIHGDADGNGRWQPVEFFADCVPATPNFGNSVTVIR